MTRAKTTIPFSKIKFIDDIPRASDLQERLKQKLRGIRMERDRCGPDEVTAEKTQTIHGQINHTDITRIKRRVMRYLERLHNSTGTQHLPQRDVASLTPLRGALPVARIAATAVCQGTVQKTGLAASGHRLHVGRTPAGGSCWSHA